MASRNRLAPCRLLKIEQRCPLPSSRRRDRQRHAGRDCSDGLGHPLGAVLSNSSAVFERLRLARKRALLCCADPTARAPWCSRQTTGFESTAAAHRRSSNKARSECDESRQHDPDDGQRVAVRRLERLDFRMRCWLTPSSICLRRRRWSVISFGGASGPAGCSTGELWLAVVLGSWRSCAAKRVVLR